MKKYIEDFYWTSSNNLENISNFNFLSLVDLTEFASENCDTLIKVFIQNVFGF